MKAPDEALDIVGVAAARGAAVDERAVGAAVVEALDVVGVAATADAALDAALDKGALAAATDARDPTATARAPAPHGAIDDRVVVQAAAARRLVVGAAERDSNSHPPRAREHRNLEF